MMTTFKDEYFVGIASELERVNKNYKCMTSILEDEYFVGIVCKLERLKKRVKGFKREEDERVIRFISNDLIFAFRKFDKGYALTVFDNVNDVYLKTLDFPYFWFDKFFRR